MVASHRLPGLDLVRSVAICLVLWDHGIRFLDTRIFGNISPHPLPDGVDLFFVLSGWLVTSRLYQKADEDRIRPGDVIVFWQKRWWRTLPAYWTVLLINIGLLAFRLTPGLLNKNAALYFVFLQNFHKPLDLFFWESWSLSVEEWFYLGFPLLLWCINGVVRKGSHAFLANCLLFIGFGLCMRILYFLYDDSLSSDLYFRKLVLCRLDMIAWGGLAYYLHKKKPMFRYGWLYVSAGLALWLLSELPADDFYQKVLKFSISGPAIAIMMPTLSQLKIPSRLVSGLLEKVSKLSYSLYLVHLGIVAGVIRTVWPTGLGWHVWLLYISASVSLAMLLYVAVERPFLRWRDKYLTR